MISDQGSPWNRLKFGESKYFYIDEYLISKQTMCFHMMKGGFDDMINTLRSDLKRYILVGTERGMIYVVNMVENRITSCISADPMLSSIHLSHNTVFASGFSKSIQGFNYLSSKANFNLVPNSQLEGYWRKGVIISKLSKNNMIIVNIGYMDFKIISSKTKKVLKTMTIQRDGSINRRNDNKQMGSPRPKYVLLNYCVMSEKGILSLLIKDDSLLYFYDIKSMQFIKKINLYEAKDLVGGNYLNNTVLLTCGKYFVVILQFKIYSKKRSLLKLKSILYIFQYMEDTPPSIDYYFHLLLPEIEIIVSHDAKQITQPVSGVEDGITFVVGTSSGVSRVFSLDFKTKDIVKRSVINKSPGRRLFITSDEEVSAIVIYKNGTICSTSDGYIIQLQGIEGNL